jgi:branched-subunit amino acid transport protein
MSQNEFLLILGMTAVTFLPRYLPSLVVGKIAMPDSLFRALRYVPVAVLTAISVPIVLMPKDTVDVGLGNAYLYAAIVSVFIAWRFQNLLATIGGGLLVFFIWRMIAGG